MAQKRTGKDDAVKYDSLEILSAATPLLDAAWAAGLKFQVCGSVRREHKQVGDLDILAVDTQIAQWYEIIQSLPEAVIRTEGERQVDFTIGKYPVNIRTAKLEAWGAGLIFFTGSKWFNIGIAGAAKKRGWKMSWYDGLLDGDGKMIAGATEEDIFRALGMPFKAPKARD